MKLTSCTSCNFSPARTASDHLNRKCSPCSSVGSSLGSSIRVCDESICSIGYLGSCEFESSCKRAGDDNADGTADDVGIVDTRHVTFCDSEGKVLSKVSEVPALDIPGAENKPIIPVRFPENQTGNDVMETVNGSDNDALDDDWVIVDGSPKLNRLQNISSLRRSSPINIFRNGQDITKTDICSANSRHHSSVGSPIDLDLSEWSVLSVKVEERSVNLPRKNNELSTCNTTRRENVICSQNAPFYQDVCASPTQFSRGDRRDYNFPECKTLKMNGSYWMAVCFIVPRP